MHLGKRFLRAIEALALWHSYFPFIPFPFTGIQRRWACRCAKRRLVRAAEEFRKHEASMEFAERAYLYKASEDMNPSRAGRSAEKRLGQKLYSRRMQTREMYRELKLLWEFLREIRVFSPEWGEGLEEFLQSFPKDRWRRELRDDLAQLYPEHDLTALSH